LSGELAEYELAVCQVHLATVAFDVHSRAHGKGVNIANGATERNSPWPANV
jgi:hypothetical protein